MFINNGPNRYFCIWEIKWYYPIFTSFLFIMFNAGTAATYGLTKEQALAAITLNAAKSMGVADKTGSIEVGKEANIIISSGDILDMRTNNVTDAFIQGRKINLDDKQKQLFDRYEQKYDLKKPAKPF